MLHNFLFLEFFAGAAGLSKHVSQVDPELIRVKEVPCMRGEWDILDDECFQSALEQVDGVDWVHAAPPHRSFTRGGGRGARGSAPAVRSDQIPRGWGHPLA